MASFTVRIELHDANWQDYDKLHKAMERAGFSRTVQAGSATYHLPTAEYITNGEFSINDTHTKAAVAALTTGKKHGILVTQSIDRLISGLSKV